MKGLWKVIILASIFPIQTFAAIDEFCMNACIGQGQLTSFCSARCSFRNYNNYDPPSPAPSKPYTQCINGCMNSGFLYAYCLNIC